MKLKIKVSLLVTQSADKTKQKEVSKKDKKKKELEELDSLLAGFGSKEFN